MRIPSSDRQDAPGSRYGRIAILLHWTIALALAFQLALGFAMPKDESGFALYQLHKSVGITILLLSLARLGWRLTHRPPTPVERGFAGRLAGAVHVLLYGFMIGTPLAGWALVSSDPVRIPTLLYGLVPWPHLPLSTGVNDVAERAHEALAWLGLALIVLHVAGALRHQLLLKDGVLSRMSPGGKTGIGFGLLALIAAIFFGTGSYVASRYLVPALERQEAAPEAAQAIVAQDALAPPSSADAAERADEASEPNVAEPVVAGPAPSWAIKPGGRLEFAIGSGDMQVRGRFTDWSGTIRFDPDRPETADIRISVRIPSATVGDATLGATLQGSDFLDSASHPLATWRSTEVRRTGPGRYAASGILTLKGIARPQPLTFVLHGNGSRRRAEGSAQIDRTAFGVGTGEAAAGLSDTARLRFEFEAVVR